MTGSKWIPVTEYTPKTYGFVWVRLASSEKELAYCYPGTRDRSILTFQYAETVGDAEGLSTEYYPDVTHVAELEPPEFP